MGEQPSFFTPEKADKSSERKAKVVLQSVIDGENYVIDARSDAHFAANLFNADILTAPDPGRLRSDFLHLHSQCENMSDYFTLFLDPRYFKYLNSLDLGKTRDPRNPENTDHLREEYRELRDKLIRAGFIHDELPRERSERTIHFRHDSLVEENKHGRKNINEKWFIGERNRPLIRFGYDQQVVTILKRMTFAVRPNVVEALADPDGRVRDPQKISIMEQALDLRDPRVVPIRTLYYTTKKGQ